MRSEAISPPYGQVCQATILCIAARTRPFRVNVPWRVMEEARRAAGIGSKGERGGIGGKRRRVAAAYAPFLHSRYLCFCRVRRRAARH